MIYEKSNADGRISITLVHNHQQNVHQIVMSNDYKGNELKVNFYELNLEIDIDTEEFTTDIKIYISTDVSRQFIVLKKGNFDITSVVLKKGDSIIRVEAILDYKPTQNLILHLEQKLPPNEYMMNIQAKGQINKNLSGLCSITLKNNESYLYITQLRPNNAYLLFPCFDQAHLTSYFQLNLVTSSKEFLRPVSNTRAEKFITDFPEERLTTVTFSKTTLMHPSKFFLAFGNYTHSEPFVTKSGFIIVVISRSEIADSLLEVPKLIKTIIETLTKYFLKKAATNSLDIILVPKKWPHMSCSGLPGVLISEEYLLSNIKKKTCLEFVKSVTFLVHELCHSWLGGDVKFDEWTDEWILEGIVSVVAHQCAGIMYPNWYDEWIPTMYQICPLLYFEEHTNVSFHKQDTVLSQVFSEHSHEEFIEIKCKSLAFFRMIWSTSPTTFRVILVNLINRKDKINNLQVWSEVWGDAVVHPEEFLKEWKCNKSYPVITVRTTYKGYQQVLTQSVFKKLTSKETDKNQGNSWTIPIKYIDLTQPKNVRQVWFPQRAPDVKIQDLEGKWFKINWHQRGLYRVNYTYDQWAHFTEMLNKNPLLLDHQDRGNLVDDAFTLAAAGYFQYHIALDLSSYITHGEERHYFPLAIAFQYLRKMYNLFHGSPGQKVLKTYMHHLIGKYLGQNVWKVNPLSPTETLRRVEIISAACWSHHPIVIEKMKDLFFDWIEDKENQNLHIDLLNHVIKYGFAHTSDKHLWRHVFHLFKDTRNMKQRLQLWVALTGTDDESFITGLLNAFIAKDHPTETILDRLKEAADNPLASKIILDFIFSRVPNLSTASGSEAIKAIECLKRLIYFVKDPNQTSQILKYVQAGRNVPEARVVEETIAEMANWQERQSDVVQEWLEQRFNKI